MKRFLPYFIAVAAIAATFGSAVYASTPAFTSFQLSTTTPISGDLLETDGSGNHWITPPSGSTLITAGTGISTSTSSGGAVLVTNTGVTSLVAGTNITLSGSTGAVTVNATGGSSFGYPFPLAGNATSTLTNFLGGLGATTVQATSTATSTLANQDGVVVATAFLGADLGAQETAAYAALPSDGGTIKIPAGFFTMSTQFNAATNGKFVSIICDPAGTYITWTGAATSTILNTGQGSGSAGQSVSNCHYAGTATSTGQVAFQIGGSNGLKNFSFDGVEVRNFGKAFGSEANSYLYTFDNDFVHGNGQDFSYESSSNAGENIRFFGGTWADCTLAVGNAASNCIDFGTFGASDVTFNSVSFDDAQVHLGAGTRSATFIGGHFENPWADTEPAYTPLLVDNSAFTNVTINGTIFTNGANTQRPVQDISNGGNVTVVSATTEDYGAGTKGVANFITNTGNGWTKVESISKQDSAYTNLYNSTGGTGTLQYNQEDSGYLGLDVLNPTSILSISASSSPQLTSLLGIASSTGNPLLNVYGGGFVTVGTTTPRFALEVVGANNTTGGNGLNLLDLVNPWTGGSGGGAGSFFQTGVLPIAQGDRLGFQAFGYTTGNANTNSVLIGAFADQAWVNGTNQGSYLDFETTADNSTVRNERMRIAANGNIGIGSTSPFFQLSVGSSNVGTFGLSTTTSGCAQFSAIGQLYSTGTACGSGGGSGTVNSGLQSQLAWYASSGTALSGTSTAPLYIGALVATSTVATSTFLGSVGIGTSTPDFSNWLSVGSTTYTALSINRTTGQVGIGCENTGATKWSFGCGSNLNVNPNINLLVTDPLDARLGTAVANQGVFMKSITGTGGGLYAYDYSLGSPRPLIFQEFGNVVGIGTTTPTAELTTVAASTTAGTVQTAYVGVVAMITGLENTTLKIFFEIDQWGHQITSGDTPTVTGGTSSVAGNDNNGTITVTGTALTSVTLKFAHAWPTAPDCTESDNSTALTADITSISATNMVVGFSVGVTSGTVWYQCRSHQ